MSKQLRKGTNVPSSDFAKLLTVIIVRREGTDVHISNVAKLLTAIIVLREGINLATS